NGNPGFFAGDEMFLNSALITNATLIATGEQNTNGPRLNYWNGTNAGTPLWIAISQCNIFLEHIGAVPDMPEEEILRWAAEVNALKAYYHFFLLRMYGPIPIMRENIPISASGHEVRVERRPVDDVFDYIVELFDEVIVVLRNEVYDEKTELGRITTPIAVALQAKDLVYA